MKVQGGPSRRARTHGVWPIVRQLALVLAATAICGLFASTAQAESELWLKAGARHMVNRQWRVAFDQHLRWSGPVSDFIRFMPELSGQYRPIPALRFELAYRFARQLDDGEWISRHRLHVDSSFKLKHDPFAFKARARLQRRMQPGLDAGDGTRTTVRPGGWLSYQIDGLPFVLEPGLGAEAFVILDHPRDGVRYQKLRAEVSAEAGFGPAEIELSYRLELPSDGEDPKTHIVSLSLSYDL